MDMGWSQLPSDLIEMVACKITNYIDYMRFRSVCGNWHSILSPQAHHLPSQFPWLMLPYNSTSSNRRGFFSLSENKVHWLNLPETYRGSRSFGSSLGWVFVLVQNNPNILLFNPLTRSQFQLLPISRNLTDPRLLCIKKIVLSTSPSLSSEYIAIAIYKGKLSFCKKGDEVWKTIDDVCSYCEDVIYFSDSFYVADNKGYVTICDVSGASPLITTIEPPPLLRRVLRYMQAQNEIYLVDSFGELLLVNKRLEFVTHTEHNTSVYKTVKFDVYRLDSSRRKPLWFKTTRLGDCLLFLGGNSSVCLLATDYSGLKGNCIYFTDYDSITNNGEKRRIRDSGVFNLGNGSIKLLPYCDGYSRLFLPPPIWVITRAR